MLTQERFEGVVSSLLTAASAAKHPDFRAIWLSKAQEIQRTELTKLKLHLSEEDSGIWNESNSASSRTSATPFSASW